VDKRTEAVVNVALDQQFSKVLAARESTVISTAVNLYKAQKLTPEAALAMWGQMAELNALEATIERNARRAVAAAEDAVEAENEEA
jgi:hypothetical protein